VRLDVIDLADSASAEAASPQLELGLDSPASTVTEEQASPPKASLEKQA